MPDLDLNFSLAGKDSNWFSSGHETIAEPQRSAEGCRRRYTVLRLRCIREVGKEEEKDGGRATGMIPAKPLLHVGGMRNAQPRVHLANTPKKAPVCSLKSV